MKDTAAPGLSAAQETKSLGDKADRDAAGGCVTSVHRSQSSRFRVELRRAQAGVTQHRGSGRVGWGSGWGRGGGELREKLRTQQNEARGEENSRGRCGPERTRDFQCVLTGHHKVSVRERAAPTEFSKSGLYDRM